MKLKVKCDFCGKIFEKYECRITPHSLPEFRNKNKNPDANKRDNAPDNILILPSLSEHAKLHMQERKFWNGGDV